MSRAVLVAAKLSKRYVEYGSELRRIATWFGASFQARREHWAVRDVSFNIKTGESLALIGQNGAGKSTLLKLITGTVRPSSGTVMVGGRVSAILELGLGFNPELTGRLNVHQAGGLMGMSGTEIGELMPEIEAFAEIGEFFDQPFRTYSSGMGARLMFALATAMRPEILIVDEVLSVGDAYFQHKSFNRIREFKRQGTSILLVTHSMHDVRELCDRVILLDKGMVLKDGTPDEVVDYYNALIADRENAKLTIEQRREKSGWLVSRSGTYEVRVVRMTLLDQATREEVAVARVGQNLLLMVEVNCVQAVPRLVLGIHFRDRTGHSVWGTNTWHTKQVVEALQAGERLVYEIDFACRLGPGSYSVSPALVSSDTHLDNNYDWTDNMLVFEVVNLDRPFFIGTSVIDAEFRIVRTCN